MSEDARQRPIKIEWTGDGLIGRITVDGEYWAAVEWSEKRQRWCVEDVEGQCLRHVGSIRGMAASKDEAVALATAMIADGRMPTPEQARAEHEERRRVAREKRQQQPSEIRRREERQEQLSRWGDAATEEWKARTAEDKAPPLYETLAGYLRLRRPRALEVQFVRRAQAAACASRTPRHRKVRAGACLRGRSSEGRDVFGDPGDRGEARACAGYSDPTRFQRWRRPMSAGGNEPPELAIYRRLEALNASRVRDVDDPALDRVLAKARAALVRELLRCVAAIERLPEAKDREVALQQRARRAGQLEFLRATVAEMGGAPQ